MFDDGTPHSTERRIEQQQVTQLLSLVGQLSLQLVTGLLSELLHSLALVVQRLACCEQ